MAHPVHRSEREGEREREKKSRKCWRALSVPHSFSQSACVIIILIVLIVIILNVTELCVAVRSKLALELFYQHLYFITSFYFI
jgi:hypothetical protein